MKNIVLWFSMLVFGLFGFGASATEMVMPMVIDPGNYGVSVGNSTTTHRSPKLASVLDAIDPDMTIESIPIYSWVPSEESFRQYAQRVLSALKSGVGLVKLRDRFTREEITATTGSGSGKRSIVIATIVKSKRGFYPSNLRFKASSSDRVYTTNLLGKVERYDEKDYEYTPDSSEAVGMDGTRITTGLWKNQLVKEFYFIGSAISTLDENNPTQAETNRGWFAAQHDLFIIGEWSLGGVVSRAKLQIDGEPVLVDMRFVRAGSGITLRVIGDLGRTVFLQKAPTVNGPWLHVAMVNGYHEQAIPLEASGFFRTWFPTD